MDYNQYNIIAIVPAAGVGSRMRSTLPKQYIKIGQLTILEYTLKKLLSLSFIKQVIVVISSTDDYFSQLNIANHPKICITYGGDTRADSVLAGLTLLDDECWALVHDAARPCVYAQDVEQLVSQVLQTDQGGILATKITDTVKKSIENSPNKLIQIDHTCDRQFLWAAATPQMFKAKELKQCLINAKRDHVALTDEASAIEYGGGKPLIVECRRNNIKVTHSEDLPLAELYLQEQSNIIRDS